MKTRANLLVVLLFIVVSALVFGGLRVWNTNRAVLGGDWPELDGGIYTDPVMLGDLQYLVSPDEVFESGQGAEARPALNKPKYDDVTTSDTSFADELEGIALEVDGDHRFYPFQILNWHPIVNDIVHDVPLAITYATLSGSAVVYRPTLNDAVLEFSDSGQVYNNTLLMSDNQSRTLWNQTSGQAVVGESDTNLENHLKIYPANVMTWQAWKDEHPDGLVLSINTGYSRDYGRHPYGSYETSPGIYFPINHNFPRLPPKQLVYRLDHTGQTLTFTARYLPFQNEPNEIIGEGEDELPVVAFYDPELDQIRVYDRRVDGQTLTFEKDRDDDRWTDKETGSEWSFDGRAISGRHRGVRLTSLVVTRHYSFAHFAMFPDTFISGDILIPQISGEESSAEVEPAESEGETVIVE